MNASIERCESVVIGAGIAGLMTALELAAFQTVTVLSAARLGDGTATAWAQGGIAAAVATDDTSELHAQDTLAAGAGLGDPTVIAAFTREAPAAIARLVELGVPFDRDPSDGKLLLGREAAHSRRRIVHAGGDATGAAVLHALIARVRETSAVRVVEDAIAEELLCDGDEIVGVAASVDGEPRAYLTRTIVLATGGIGGLFRATTNPLTACGDGIALAAQAGAVLADLEFVQFHPTALATGRDPMPLITEALRGAGAWVVDERDERFLFDVDARGELAPRDVVAQAVYHHRAAGHAVFIDGRDSVGDRFPERFPTAFAHCCAAGIDPRTTLIPIAPAAHYHMGGVAVDETGRTSLAGLWACGEVAATGVHGANRLASNSLVEAVVSSAACDARAGAGVASLHLSAGHTERARRVLERLARARFAIDGEKMVRLRRAMYDGVGVARDVGGLLRALDEIRELGRGETSPRMRHRLLVAELVARAALARRESRGAHRRIDYPNASAALERRSFVRLSHSEARVS
ncbi:MAG: L-aspartate oxidase [Vulcanimicrobiaceae bacterium]